MRRRNVWLAGAAAGALGVGWQLWQQRGPAPVPPAIEDDALTGGLWQMSFPQPDGGTLVMAALRGQPLLLNFWGTWCPPCIEEMPDLDRFAREFAGRGWRVVGLAVDNLKSVREFLSRSPVSYTIAIAGFEGTELTRKLGNTQSGLPFTVVFDRAGKVVARQIGITSRQQLESWGRMF